MIIQGSMYLLVSKIKHLLVREILLKDLFLKYQHLQPQFAYLRPASLRCASGNTSQSVSAINRTLFLVSTLESGSQNIPNIVLNTDEIISEGASLRAD